MDPLYLNILKEFNVASPKEAKMAAAKALHDAEIAYQKADEALDKALRAFQKARHNQAIVEEFIK